MTGPVVQTLEALGEFGKWVRRERERAGLQVTEAAQLAGLSRSTWQSVEGATGDKGKTATNRSVEIYARVAAALGMELGFVLHKAGFPIGKNDVNMARLKRVEETLGILSEREHQLRRALAEALEHDTRPGAAEMYGRALGALDLTTEKLREDRRV